MWFQLRHNGGGQSATGGPFQPIPPSNPQARTLPGTAARRWLWPIYWFAQGTMFWALFVIGHDCGHQSFSNNKALNDFVGHLTHSSILVPYHGGSPCQAHATCCAWCSSVKHLPSGMAGLFGGAGLLGSHLTWHLRWLHRAPQAGA